MEEKCERLSADDLTDTEEYKHECWKLGLAASETMAADAFSAEVERLQGLCTTIVEAWVSNNVTKLQATAKSVERATVRMATLKASGLGLLANTNAIWNICDGATRMVIEQTLKKLRKAARSRDSVFILGAEHKPEAPSSHTGKYSASCFKDYVVDLVEMFLRLTNHVVRVEIARKVAIILVQHRCVQVV